MNKMWFMPLVVAMALMACGHHSPTGTDSPGANKPVVESTLSEVPPDTLVSAEVSLSDRIARPLEAGLVSVSAWQGGVRFDSAAVDLTQVPKVKLFVSFAPGDWDLNGVVGFEDFFKFASFYNTREGEAGFSPRFDLDASGQVDFPDFFIFADHFGQRAPAAAAKPVVFPDSALVDNRGRVSETEFREMWQILKSRTMAAAKVAATQQEEGVMFRVRARDNSFAPLDTLVTGTFAPVRRLDFRVNRAPWVMRPDERLNAFEGDTISVSFSGVFSSDDRLSYDLARSDNNLAMVGNRLVGRARASGEFTTIVRATDPVGQSAIWMVTLAVTRDITRLYNAEVSLTDLRLRALTTGQASISVWQGDVRLDARQGQVTEPARLMLPFAFGDFNGDGQIDMADFLLLVPQIGKREGQPGYLPRYDLDGNGVIEEADQVIFSRNFNKTGRGVASKLAVLDTGYVFKVRSLDNGFAPADSLFEDLFASRQNIVLRVNTPPKPVGEVGDVTLTVGDSVVSIVSRFFESDDALEYTVESEIPWSLTRDSVLTVLPRLTGKFVFIIRGTDTAGQPLTYRFTVTVNPRPDRIPPVVSVSFNADSTLVNYSVADSSNLAVRTVVTLDQTTVKDDTTARDSIRLALSDGNHSLVFVATDQAGNIARLEHQLVKPDRTPPDMEVLNPEWVGVQKNLFVFVGHFVDAMSSVGSYGVHIPAAGYDHSSVAGRQDYRISLETTFPTVRQVTRREIRLRARDSAGNLAEKSVYVDQPVSPDPPPPPPPPPPPANVAPSISSATVNGQNMVGTITVAAGSTLALAASFSGTPGPQATWRLGSQTTTGSSASLTAQSGTLTLTVSNSEGTVTRSCNIVALGAP